jgi:phosphatidylinositol alpha-1,6-mannosyltransferase
VTSQPSAPPLRILLVAEVFPPAVGGSGRWAWELYRRLPAAQVSVAAGLHPGSTEFDQLAPMPIDRVPLAFGSWGVAGRAGLLGYGRALGRLRTLTREQSPAQVHAGKSLPEGLLALRCARPRGLPVVVYVHGEELNIARGSRELRCLTRLVLRRATLVVANSGNTRAELANGWTDPARVAVLHPGVDVERFHPARRDEPARARLGWTGRRVVLTVGRLQRRKGHDVMIAALARVRERVPDVLYAIVGDGEERKALEARVTSLGLQGHVQFRGAATDDEMVSCYQQCDLFVLPNRTVDGDFEGFGMVLVEAQACGTPVVAGTSGGTAETLSEGVTGRLVPCDQPEPLADGVASLLLDGDRRGAMAAQARAWAVERFAWGALASEAVRLFREL